MVPFTMDQNSSVHKFWLVLFFLIKLGRFVLFWSIPILQGSGLLIIYFFSIFAVALYKNKEAVVCPWHKVECQAKGPGVCNREESGKTGISTVAWILLPKQKQKQYQGGATPSQIKLNPVKSFPRCAVKICLHTSILIAMLFKLL